MKPRGFLLFDIDGVIRNVENSYRLAIKNTVNNFCGWIPQNKDIDQLKNEGCWNNDWDASYELIKRHRERTHGLSQMPSREKIIELFNDFYFGGDLNGNPNQWNGFIKNEPLLVQKEFFKTLDTQHIKWGFVSGAEAPSAKFILEKRLGLENPPLIAMGQAPEKPDPTGFLLLAKKMVKTSLGIKTPAIGYLGDTIADVKTILNARLKVPEQKFISFAVAPPHLQTKSKKKERIIYEENLKNAGADIIINTTNDILNIKWF